MTSFLKLYPVRATRIINLLLLSNILLINSCHCNRFPEKKEKNKIENKVDNATTKPAEVIVFLGNPGVGKSTLCNSIFGKAIFNSGISIGTGMTTHEQEYNYENKLYIDTPGLNDAIIERKKQAAEEIEKALKHNNNYKIIFVLTLEAGRMSYTDLVTINTVCDAIQTKFEYGIIFNKVTSSIIQQISQEGTDKYLAILHKRPSLIAILRKDNDMEDAAGAYFQIGSENREKLLGFLKTLHASSIGENEINKIDVRDTEEKLQAIEEKYKKLLEEQQRIIEEGQKLMEEGQNIIEQGQKLTKEQLRAFEEKKSILEQKLEGINRQLRELQNKPKKQW